MKILIIGATGCLGPHIVDEIVKNEFTPILLGRELNKIESFKRHQQIEVDLLKLKVENLPTDIDSIIYLAQSRNFRNFPEMSDDIFTINTLLPYQIAKWVQKNNIKNFTYFSTGAVYKNTDGLPKKEDSELSLFSNNFYANSKLSAEQLISSFKNSIKSLKIIRPFFIFGPYQSEDMLIPRLFLNVQNGKDIMIDTNGGVKINPIFAPDAAKIIIPQIFNDGFEVLNLAGKEEINIKDIATYFSSILKQSPVFKLNDANALPLIGDIAKTKNYEYQPLKESLSKISETL
tara:strand:+ start:126227 stop:127093 length:867 start_codon:yes stop_codon:yes gene_type:complete